MSLNPNGLVPQWLPVEDQPSKDELIGYVSGMISEMLQAKSYKAIVNLYYRLLLIQKENDPHIFIDAWVHSYVDTPVRTDTLADFVD